MRPVEEPSNECLIRIQHEISEVEKREMELRNEHAMMSPRSMSIDEDKLSDARSPSPPPQHQQQQQPLNFCSKDQFKKNKIIEPQPRPLLLAPPALTLTRAVSTPQLFNVSPVKISSPHRGIMQKFIASRGKLNVNVNQINRTVQNNNFKQNLIMAPIEFNNDSIKALQIERDTKGRPIRKGYVPVEEKIQSELRDLKTRETELKRLHKFNVNINSEDDEEGASSSDDIDGDWKPINGKLSRSIDVLNNHSSPSPTLEASRPIPQPRNGNYIRPAMSLAALCDFEPDSETPSSHKLIERWESIIQEKNQQRGRSYNIN